MKTIAIVGCNRGIGLELVKKYKNEGYKVYGFCRNSSAELTNVGIENIITDFDVLNTNSLKSSVDSYLDEKLDELIHVSGILTSETITKLEPEQITQQFKVNSLGPLITVEAFLPYLKNGSKIGLVTSRMGSVEDNTSGGMYGYRMSKAALNMAGKSLAIDLKPKDISVILLHPGYVQTDMTGQQGNITPEESAKGLFDVFNSKSLIESGNFYHVNGDTIPW